MKDISAAPVGATGGLPWSLCTMEESLSRYSMKQQVASFIHGCIGRAMRDLQKLLSWEGGMERRADKMAMYGRAACRLKDPGGLSKNSRCIWNILAKCANKLWRAPVSWVWGRLDNGDTCPKVLGCAHQVSLCSMSSEVDVSDAFVR